eukprot:Blabericola_migrator_1__2127@NODE_1588_length_4223_cov_110_912175_g1038_i0_p5_GENE_NODE_1588_length_4223_cov_110_912175_g1038_i0NODE_1588_length_4223_cov_110_912175_g1038_i0_p5_ORF_typecomplete_len141_score22_78_NODE_1588_length_4223_cov_110_912175_g1038_i036884110
MIDTARGEASVTGGGRRRQLSSIDPKKLFVCRWVKSPDHKSMELMVDRKPGMSSHFAVTAPTGMDFHDVYKRERKACGTALHLVDQLEPKDGVLTSKPSPEIPCDQPRLKEIPDRDNEWFQDPKEQGRKGLADHLNVSLL